MNRLYHLDIPIIAITGGIATGKSMASKILMSMGEKIIDADFLVKKIYSKNQTKDWLEKNIPSVIKENEIDFKVLRKIFFSDNKTKTKVEQFIYSKLESAFKEEITTDQSYIIYDVPLLFEKSIHTKVDETILIYCNRQEQLRRICQRDQISTDLALKILDAQLDIEWKKKQDVHIINNDLNEDQTYKNMKPQLIKTLEKIKKELNI